MSEWEDGILPMLNCKKGMINRLPASPAVKRTDTGQLLEDLPHVNTKHSIKFGIHS